MKVKVSMKVGEEAQIDGMIEIDDYKLEELSEEEIEAAIEILVKNWANDRIRIEWEVAEGEEQE
ncbi:hypothetical protein [Paenibacillus sp. MBLB4367]|uniref:hypothetical protein n=1 Tax=Paenibacillus sp. MBLB4367 TaxID=3384767 RepID=UPI00390829B4